ncbi:phosphatidate cytidylyltransferase [Lachnoclostridium phytofermentans]|uniref:Phosphatidate cytidylyltransferase n=1 Tax=Lachnoclostridium phytofermentans (strain ATCC 700394 / DSM 18823 / ISDg) TaxID=357809 RepID=A9KMX3_LACP7|nr:phosphatidate cytidylyltransferase [Lachnoclostridium phytofermentans]ABX42984.1 phosphatidate cytidylyltransferase [Lachnoclostridium phytofermentans ISDg]
MKDQTFLVRFRSSIILMIVTVTAMILGGEVLFGLLLAISLIGMMELYRVLKMNKSILAFTGYIFCILFYMLVYFSKTELIFPLLIGFLLALMGVYVFSFPKFHSDQVTLVYFGLIYVGIMLSFIYRVRILENGILLVWMIFIGAWGSDTCAYLVGRKIGKHKMAPILSPKKSVEGLFGGIFGAALIGFLFATIFKGKLTAINNPQVSFEIIGGCSAMISTIGDLAASAIKRNHEVKDYGKLIPGHGGILDRFDSIIFTAPIVYYLLQVL